MQEELASHTDINNSLIGSVSVRLPKEPNLEFAPSGVQIGLGSFVQPPTLATIGVYMYQSSLRSAVVIGLAMLLQD
jgi:hypothetical protein